MRAVQATHEHGAFAQCAASNPNPPAPSMTRPECRQTPARSFAPTACWPHEMAAPIADAHSSPGDFRQSPPAASHHAIRKNAMSHRPLTRDVFPSSPTAPPAFSATTRHPNPKKPNTRPSRSAEPHSAPPLRRNSPQAAPTSPRETPASRPPKCHPSMHHRQ